MSAAEPADPRPNSMNISGDAAVIDINARSARGPKASQRRWKKVSATPPPGPGGPDKDAPQTGEPLAELADHIETTLNHHHLTLTGEATATAYTVTLQIVRGVLQGAQAQGIVTAEQLVELDELIEGMAAAPQLV
jgi:hypothetical protein